MTVRDNFQFVYHGPSSTNGHKSYVNWKVEGNYISGAWSVEDLEWLQEQAQVQIDNLRQIKEQTMESNDLIGKRIVITLNIEEGKPKAVDACENEFKTEFENIVTFSAKGTEIRNQNTLLQFNVEESKQLATAIVKVLLKHEALDALLEYRGKVREIHERTEISNGVRNQLMGLELDLDSKQYMLETAEECILVKDDYTLSFRSKNGYVWIDSSYRDWLGAFTLDDLREIKGAIKSIWR